MDERFQLTPVSYVVFRRRNCVLLQLRQGTDYLDGHWATAAAGHVESNESAIDAAAREAYEELGIVLSSADLRPLVVMHRKQGGAETRPGRVDFFFECTSWPTEPQLMEKNRASDLRWFRLDDLPSPVVPHERHVLERLSPELPPIITLGF